MIARREAENRFPRGWCSAQRIINPMIAGGNHTTIPSCRQSALRNRLVTEEECGRQRWMIGNLKAYSCASYPTLVEVCYVVRTFRFPPAFLS